MIPNLRKFLAEGDKVLAVCNSIVASTINPAMKGRSRYVYHLLHIMGHRVTSILSRPLDVDENVLSVLREMTRLSAAMKAWRAPIVEVLNDNRCFNSTPSAGQKWRQMVKMLFDTDKTALAELLSKLQIHSSAFISLTNIHRSRNNGSVC